MASEGNSSQVPGWLLRALVGRSPKRTLVRAAALVALSFLVFTFVLLPIRVAGISMQPTYRDGSINCINCLAYLFHEPRRGDIVAIKTTGKHNMYLKRIIGLPGETVEFRAGQAFINGQPLEEPYATRCNWNRAPERLRSNEYFVVGDNRTMAEGDHEKGAARRDRLIGKILL